MHLALTGDDSQHDTDLILAMAELSRDQHYYQAKVDDIYDTQSEPFTERAAGIILLAQISAYELTGDADLLVNINKRVATLNEHRLLNPDGHPADGSWRHSWSKHEGAKYPGDDVSDDKRFSPWMSENIIDALWHVYQINPTAEIEEMIVSMSRALIDWGFTDSLGYKEKYGKTIEEYAQKTWHNGCNTTGDTTLYSGSSVASLDAIIKTQSNDGWYSDNHNPEIMLMLALGYNFETHSNYKLLIKERLASIKEGTLRAACGKNDNTKRQFNWNNRSNYWGTYLWAVENNPELIESAASNDDSKVTAKYAYSVNDDFSNGYDTIWSNTDVFSEDGLNITPTAKGLQFLNPIAIEGTFEVELGFVSQVASTLSYGLVLDYGNNGFYSIRVKGGQWGGVFVYQHSSVDDLTGTFLTSKPVAVDLETPHVLKAIVNKGNVTLQLNGEDTMSFDVDAVSVFNQVGLLSTLVSSNIRYQFIKINHGSIKSLLSFKPDFTNPMGDYWINTPSWEYVDGKLIPSTTGWLLSKEFHDKSEYTIRSETVLNETSASLMYGLVFGQTDDSYYTIKLKSGTWGGVYIYKHMKDVSWDVAGAYRHHIPLTLALNKKHVLEIKVSNNIVAVNLDGEYLSDIKLEDIIVAGNVGYVTSAHDIQTKISEFNTTYYQ